MRRLGISLLMVVVISVLGAGWVMDVLFARLDKGDSDSLDLVTKMGYQLAAQIDGNSAQVLLPSKENDALNDEFVLLEQDELSLPSALQAQLESGQVLTLESGAGVVLYYFLSKSNQVLAIKMPEKSTNRTRLRLLLTVLFYLAIVGFLLLWLSPLIRRLQRLAVVAKQFGEGQLDSRISTQPSSNLHDIETEFNRMAQRIQGLLDDNRMLTSAVSHDLRTPLSRLRFGIDALAEQTNDSLQSNYLDRLSADLGAMEQLVEVLLEFARLEQRLTEIPLRSIELITVLTQTIEYAQSTAGCKIELHKPLDEVLVLGDERYVNMLFNNLLQNAIRFASSVVKVSVDVSGSQVWLRVEDDGQGLEPADRDRLLKPFERGNGPGGNRANPSYGLGLAIVQRIADWHGGLVELGDSQLLGGACISVLFTGTDKSK